MMKRIFVCAALAALMVGSFTLGRRRAMEFYDEGYWEGYKAATLQQAFERRLKAPEDKQNWVLKWHRQGDQ